jgi:hypothetical protein
MALNELGRNGLDSIGLRYARVPFLSTGITAFRHGSKGCASQFARGGEVNCGVSTKGVLARMTMMAIANGPRTRPRWLDNQIKPGQESVGDLAPLRSGLG